MMFAVLFAALGRALPCCYWVTALIAALLFSGCFVDGHPYEPCPTVTVYMGVDSTGVLATDSITRGCP